MNKNNPFEGKAVKFDTAEQLEHLAELARGFGLKTDISFETDYFFFRKDVYGRECYYNYSTPFKLPEIHYSDFVASIESAKESETINKTVDNILMSHEVRNNKPDPIAQPQPDMVNHPKHYNVKGFEVIDIIDAFGLNFNMGNALKYLLRADRKGNKEQDIQKALWYLQREINTK